MPNVDKLADAFKELSNILDVQKIQLQRIQSEYERTILESQRWQELKLTAANNMTMINSRIEALNEAMKILEKHQMAPVEMEEMPKDTNEPDGEIEDEDNLLVEKKEPMVLSGGKKISLHELLQKSEETGKL